MGQAINDAISALGLAQTEETKGKYLTFLTDAQLFGVPIADVVQIVGMQMITEIPDYPAYAKGVINLRGSIIPVIDVRSRLGKPEMEYTDRTCIIVSNIGDQYFGFIVEEVNEVTDIPDIQISPPPQMGSEITNFYLTGIARLEDGDSGKIVLLIDTAKILGENELKALAQATEQ